MIQASKCKNDGNVVHQKMPVKSRYLLIFAGESVTLFYRREQHGRMDEDKDITGTAITSAVHCYTRCHQDKYRDTNRRLPC